MIVDLEQGSQAWLDWRDNGIGASDIPVILGLSPYATPRQLWEAKMGLSEAPDSFIFRRGHDAEVLARGEYERQTGVDVTPMCVQHDEYPWLRASLDGANMDMSVIQEIKLVGEDELYSVSQGQVPERYRPQVQCQLQVTGAGRCDFVAYCDGAIFIVQVQPDYDLFRTILEEGLAFYRSMADFTPPPLSDRDEKERTDPEWRRAAAQFLVSKAALASAKDLEKQDRETLIDLATHPITAGCGVRVSTTYKGSVAQRRVTATKEAA